MSVFRTLLPWLAALLLFLPLMVLLYGLALQPSSLPPLTGRYTLNTLFLVIGTAAVSAALGVTGAWLTVMTHLPGRRLWQVLLPLPLAMPSYVTVYYWDVLWQSSQALSGLFSLRNIPLASVLLGASFSPYVYLLTENALQRGAANTFLAGRTLGAAAWRSFARLALPLLLPAFVAGVLLTVLETLAEFGAAQYLGIQTLTVGIMRGWLATGSFTMVLPLVMTLACMAILFLLAEKGLQRRLPDGMPKQSAPLARLPLSRAQQAMGWLLCGFIAAVGFVVPFAVIVLQAVQVAWSPALWEALRSTLLLGAGTGALLTVLAVGLRLLAGNNAVLLRSLFSVGYALPGLVTAIGLLAVAPLTGLKLSFLSGSIAALIYVYAVRFFAPAWQSVDSAMKGECAHSVHAAATLGAGTWRRWRFIRFPALQPALLLAAALAMMDVIKELPATLLLRPFGVETLATVVYYNVHDERWQEASPAALMLFLCCALVVTLMRKNSH